MSHSPQDVHKKVLGKKGEKLVVEYLKKQGCKVLEKVEDGTISKSRHESYKTILDEIKDNKKWEV